MHYKVKTHPNMNRYIQMVIIHGHTVYLSGEKLKKIMKKNVFVVQF